MKTQITIALGFCLVALTLFVCFWHREPRVIVVSTSEPEVGAAHVEEKATKTPVVEEAPLAPRAKTPLPNRPNVPSAQVINLNARAEAFTEQRVDTRPIVFTPEAGQADVAHVGIVPGKLTIRVIGSDTMVNLAQAWAEAYRKVEPDVSVEVSGGGSGIGVAALVNGTCDIAHCSRKFEPAEVEKAKAKYGGEPKEFMVGYDALSICVHPSNPLNEITIDQLSEIYRDGGKIDKWSDLGVKMAKNNIVRVSRQNNSGTYQFFQERIVGKGKDFKVGSRDMNGSKDVVELVSRTSNAIGYCGMGYLTATVKSLKISDGDGQPAIAPTIETTRNQTYPIGRPLFVYTPPPHVEKYIRWILSTDGGQEIVEQSGYVPLVPQQTASLE